MTSTEPISVRDFLRNFAAIVQGRISKRYVVMKHGKPIGVFTPWEIQKKESAKQTDQKTQRWAWLDAMRKHQFHSGENNLTDKIDEIVYGIGRNTYPD